MQFDYARYDAVGLASLLRTGQLSPLEIVEAAIHQIELLNPQLNALTVKLYEQARLQAAKVNLQLPLAGIPMLLKDLLADYAGVPTSFGNAWLSQHPVSADGELVKRYKKAGLVIVGKTNVPELGLGAVTESDYYGPAYNPWAKHLTAGGSSGGSAVAVAAGMVPIAHANDGGGSIRIPASCCGVFGLKPSRGLVPSASTLGLRGWQGLIVEHVLTRSVRDSALVLDATANQLPARSYSDCLSLTPSALRIGVVRHSVMGNISVAKECLDAVQQAAALCEQLGHQVDEIHLPFKAEHLQHIYTVIVAAEIDNLLARFAHVFGKGLTANNLELINAILLKVGESFTAADYAIAIAEMDDIAMQLQAVMEKYDVLLTPVLAAPPVPLGTFKPKPVEKLILQLLKQLPVNPLLHPFATIIGHRVYDYVAFTPLCNLTGNPAMSVPLYWTRDNIPIGVHFIGRLQSDALLLQLAAQLEQACPWSEKYLSLSVR